MRDSKNPNQWRRVIQCRTADYGPTLNYFKDAVLETCDQRDDEWAHKVNLRIGGSMNDLSPRYSGNLERMNECLTTPQLKTKFGQP